jgi:hypothetical protein
MPLDHTHCNPTCISNNRPYNSKVNYLDIIVVWEIQDPMALFQGNDFHFIPLFSKNNFIALVIYNVNIFFMAYILLFVIILEFNVYNVAIIHV